MGKKEKPRHSVGAFAVVPNAEGHVLLCHRRDIDAWNLPGGVVEHGESPWTAVVREVEEETGLFVKVVRLSGIYSKPDKHEIVFSFLCTVTGGGLQPSDEADALDFFSPAGLPDNLLAKQKERVIDWYRNPHILHMKEQPG